MRYKPQRLHLIAILSIVLTIGVGYAVADSRILLTMDPGQSANPFLLEDSGGTDVFIVEPDGDLAITDLEQLANVIGGCAPGEILELSGSDWVCGTDDTGAGGSGNGLNTTNWDFTVYQDEATGNTIAEFGNGTEYLNSADDGTVIRGVADQGGAIFIEPGTYTVTAAAGDCGANAHLYLWNNTHFYGGGINNTIIDFTSANNGATEHCSATRLSFNIGFHDMSFNCPPAAGGGDCMRLRMYDNYEWENVSFYGAGTHIFEIYNGIDSTMTNVRINNYGTGAGILFANQTNFVGTNVFIDNNLGGNHCFQQKREGENDVQGFTTFTNFHVKDCGNAATEHGMRFEYGNVILTNFSIKNPYQDGINVSGANNTMIFNNGKLEAGSNTQVGSEGIELRDVNVAHITIDTVTIEGNEIWDEGIKTGDGSGCNQARTHKCLRDMTFRNISINGTTNHGVLFDDIHDFKFVDSTILFTGNDGIQLLSNVGYCTIMGNTILNYTTAAIDDDSIYGCIGVTDPAGAGTMNQCAGGNC